MPIVTISRGTFSGGKAVAEGVAARLNYPCVSREILLESADTFGLPEEKIALTLREPPKFWRDNPARLLAHLNYSRAVLTRLARDGRLVYHGFAGHLLLGGISHVLRVRVIADPEYRVDAAVKELGLSRDKAFSLIRNNDEQSLKWAKALYGVTWNDPSLYDVVLNLDRLNLESAVQVVADMAGLPDFQPTAESLRVFEDLALSGRVWAALAADPLTGKADVRVTSRDGEVTVTGNAASKKVLEAIPAVARRVEGVREVRCEVGVGAHWMW